MPLAPGTKLGPYEILAPIGAGGMGEVYRAHDARLNRDVAIKVLPETIATGRAWERFEREARAASALNHPNICSVYDVGEAEGQPFLVMELLEGKTLRDFIGKKPVEPKVAAALAAQIADALEAAHAKGIIHRDIKPGNIMVTGREHVKVLDFGLAKRAPTGTDETRTLDSLTAAGTLVGTPSYIAPEVLQGKEADARSDLWALGVVLYEMLTGRLPFTGPTVFEVSSAILHEDPPPLPATVPFKLKTIVERCLDKDPEERYQNAGDVRAGLVTATTAAASSRRGWLWGATAAAALAVGGILWWQGRPQSDTRKLTSTGAPASANQEANEAFELAIQFLQGQNDLSKSQGLFEQALVLDPHFAEALRYHAFIYTFQILNGYSNDTNLLYKAEEELRRASQEDPGLLSVHTPLGAAYLMLGRKEMALAELDLAPAQGRSLSEMRLWRMIYFSLEEDNTAAKELARDILDRDSLFMPARYFLGEILRTEGDVPGAIREQQKVQLQAPDNVAGFWRLALAYMDGGELDKARSLLEAKRAGFSGNYLWRQASAILLALEGKRTEALQAMDEPTLKFAGTAFIATLHAAEFYALLGDREKAVEWLDRAVRNGDERVAWFRKDRWLASIHQDPRFRHIIESIEARRKPR